MAEISTTHALIGRPLTWLKQWHLGFPDHTLFIVGRESGSVRAIIEGEVVCDMSFLGEPFVVVGLDEVRDIYNALSLAVTVGSRHADTIRPRQYVLGIYSL